VVDAGAAFPWDGAGDYVRIEVKGRGLRQAAARRKNEAILRQTFPFLGFVEAAHGLEFLKLAEGFAHGAMQALFVEAEVDEVLGVLPEGAGGGEDGMNVGVLGVELAGAFEMRIGEHAVFDGSDAIDAPLIVGNGLRELARPEFSRRGCR